MNLPIEIQNEIMLYVSHPTADLMRPEIEKFQDYYDHGNITFVSFHFDSYCDHRLCDYYDNICDCCWSQWSDRCCVCQNCGEEYYDCRTICSNYTQTQYYRL